MRLVNRDPRDIVLHGLAALVGLAFVAAPWLAGFADVTWAVWNAVLVGAVIAALGLAAIFHDVPAYHGYGYIALGVWAIVAPWIIGFSVLAAALYAHLTVGILTALLGALAVWFTGNRPLSTA